MLVSVGIGTAGAAAGVGLSIFLSVDPVPGGSANGYDFVSGDPVNGQDLTGTRQCLKGGVLGSASANHVRARICVVGRSRKERAQGLVRVQFEISVRGFWERQETIAVEVAIQTNDGQSRFDAASPFDPIHPQTSAHTSIALRPGEGGSVFGIAHLLSGDIAFFGYFIVPDESVYGP